MTTAPSDRALALFDAALDRPEAERAAFLDAACAGDAALRARVEALLQADTVAHPLFDATPAQLAAVLPEEPPPSFEGREIGPYRIARELGRGGMGTVYLAERADVGKRVALKLVAGGLADPDRIGRFLFERRVLARLEHPHVARLLDAGVADDGTPWFAMEYVEGVPLDRYCDGHRLSVAERLALFERVCEAVAYAHRHLVVHRDLKPSNVLVTEEGEVKLLDFGIARLLEEDEPGLTRTGVHPLTPDYAAPEQVLGRPVTTATDVYQLGVVLYELLAGRRPYRLGGQSLGEVERRIVHEDPPKPSTAVARVEDATPEAVAQARSTEPERLRRRLRGELDALVMKALAKEPERRYPSAEGLLDDLRRYRAGLPLTARPATPSYRARKFVARHPVGLGVAGAFVVLVAAFVALYTVRVTAERNRAQLEARKAERVSGFLVDLFTASDPFSASAVRIDTMSVRAFMEERAARVTELGDQPEVQLEVLDAVGAMFYSMGVYEQAVPLREQVLALARALYPDPHPQVADAFHGLGELYRIVDRRDEAEALFREALADFEQLGMGDSLAASYPLTGLGEVLRQQGRLAEAEPFYEKALAVRSRAFPNGDPALTQSLNNYALVLWQQGRLAEAEPAFREALTAYRRQLGPDHPRVAAVLHNLGLVYRDQGRYDQAEAALRESIAVKRATLGDRHWRVANGLSALAGTQYDRGDLAGAEALYREALAIQRAAFGDDHVDVAFERSNLADVLRDQGRTEEAERLYRTVLAWLREHVDADHADLEKVRLGYGELLLVAGRLDEAEPLLEAALATRRARYGDDHWQVARKAELLGALRTAQGRYAEAEALLQPSLATLDATCPRPDCSAPTLQRLVALYEAWGRPAQAAPYRSRLTTRRVQTARE